LLATTLATNRSTLVKRRATTIPIILCMFSA